MLLSLLPIQKRTYNALTANGTTTTTEVLELGYTKLCAIKNLGAKSVNTLLDLIQVTINPYFDLVSVTPYTLAPFDLDTLQSGFEIEIDEEEEDLEEFIIEEEEEVSIYQEDINKFSSEDFNDVENFASSNVKLGFSLKDLSEDSLDVVYSLYAVKSTCVNDKELIWGANDWDVLNCIVEDIKTLDTRLRDARVKGNETLIKRALRGLETVKQDIFTEWFKPSSKKINGQKFYIEQCIKMCVDDKFYEFQLIKELKERERKDIVGNVKARKRILMEILELEKRGN